MKNKGLFPFITHVCHDIINRWQDDLREDHPQADLENCRGDAAISERNEKDMAKERRKIIIGYSADGMPVYKQLNGINQEDINQQIVQAYIESGRIYEMMPGLQALQTTQGQGSDILLKDYAEKWLARKRKLKPNTFVKYRKNLKEYILPCLGEMALQDIRVEDVQAMMDRFSHLAQKTIKGALAVLSQIMKYAVDDDLIKKNPCLSHDLEIPSDRKTEREALPIDQYKEILANLYKLNKNDRRFMGLLMYTGMRRGEALGLRWEDIDLEKNVLTIQRNVTHPQQNTPVVTTPKTKAGRRSIPIDPNLLEMLKPMGTEGYILTGKDPMTLTGHRNMMKRINQTIDLHGATAHVLRHSYLTYAVGETTDYKTVQGISGHADIGTLLNRYAHPQENKVRALSNSMHNILKIE